MAKRLLAGAKVAVMPVRDTKPDTNVVPCSTLIVVVVMVEASMATLKVAAIFWLKGTPVAALAGSVELTVGGVMTAAAPVVKLQTKLFARAFPARSLTPVEIVAVYTVFGARLLAGAKVAVVPV